MRIITVRFQYLKLLSTGIIPVPQFTTVQALNIFVDQIYIALKTKNKTMSIAKMGAYKQELLS